MHSLIISLFVCLFVFLSGASSPLLLFWKWLNSCWLCVIFILHFLCYFCSDLDSQRKSQALPPLPDQKPADSLKQYPWFLGPLDKKVAENALNSFSKEGAFIVRNSSKDLNSYSMSLYFNRSVRHLRIPRLQNKKYVLGDSGKVQFDTIVELVDYYSQHHVDLRSGGSTSLTAACPVK